MARAKIVLISLLKLIRWQNLLIIAFVMFASYYAIIESFYDLAGIKGVLGYSGLFLLIAATMLTAASGYVINDCIDIRTDGINKPDKIIVGKTISHNLAMRFYYALNILSLAFGFLIAYYVGSWRLGLLFPMGIILLWLYSAKYKSSVAIGNVIVSILSGMVIVVVWLFEFFSLLNNPGQFVIISPFLSTITWYFTIFGLFAFLVSLAREVIKDAEDFSGDSGSGIETIATKFGTQVSKRLSIVVLLLTCMLIMFVSWYFFDSNMIFAGYFYLIAVLPLILYITYKTRYAVSKADFNLISLLLKVVMLAGIIGLQPITMSL